MSFWSGGLYTLQQQKLPFQKYVALPDQHIRKTFLEKSYNKGEGNRGRNDQYYFTKDVIEHW